MYELVTKSPPPPKENILSIAALAGSAVLYV